MPSLKLWRHAVSRVINAMTYYLNLFIRMLLNFRIFNTITKKFNSTQISERWKKQMCLKYEKFICLAWQIKPGADKKKIKSDGGYLPVGAMS